jgi:hypothetical protein
MGLFAQVSDMQDAPEDCSQKCLIVLKRSIGDRMPLPITLNPRQAASLRQFAANIIGTIHAAQHERHLDLDLNEKKRRLECALRRKNTITLVSAETVHPNALSVSSNT